MISKRERVTLIGVVGLAFLAVCLLDADPMWPGWVTWTMVLLVTGGSAWMQWKLSGNPDKRTLNVILPVGFLVIAVASLLILLATRL
jgi:hypothetical protein